MTDKVTWLKERLEKIYDRNPYVKLLQMRFDDVGEGRSRLSMSGKHEVHGNLWGQVHGGALASLADTAMGVACASSGNAVVTLDMNINFLAGAAVGSTVTAVGQVIHSGKTTMVVECELTDPEGRLLAKARGTFFVTGKFETTEN